MRTLELKNTLIDKVNKIEDDFLLEQLLLLIEFENGDSKIEIQETVLKDLQNISKKMDKGEFFAHDEIVNDMKSWLKK